MLKQQQQQQQQRQRQQQQQSPSFVVLIKGPILSTIHLSTYPLTSLNGNLNCHLSWKSLLLSLFLGAAMSVFRQYHRPIGHIHHFSVGETRHLWYTQVEAQGPGIAGEIPGIFVG